MCLSGVKIIVKFPLKELTSVIENRRTIRSYMKADNPLIVLIEFPSINVCSSRYTGDIFAPLLNQIKYLSESIQSSKEFGLALNIAR